MSRPVTVGAGERLKRTALDALTSRFVLPVFRPFTQGVASTFMLHRFHDETVGAEGHSARLLRANLSWLRREGFAILGLTELLDRLQDRAPLHRAVVLTVDDGYGDFARVAAPVFAEFDCPVTVFLASGFLDGRCWYWWDQLDHATARSRRSELTIELASGVHRCSWSGEAERRIALDSLVECLKRVPDDQRQAAVAGAFAALEVDVPPQAPARFAPITWDDARRLARGGVTFGPHSDTHPAFSQISAERSEREIRESWHRLRTELDAPLPVFCYPFGTEWSFTGREQETLRRLGMRAALTAIGAHVGADIFHAAPLARFALPRFAYEEDGARFRQTVGGLERAKTIVRRSLRRATMRT